MFWRKISFHTQEFIVNLWKGVDQAIDDYYAEGELVVSILWRLSNLFCLRNLKIMIS